LANPTSAGITAGGDATVTDCNAVLKWSEGSHIAGDFHLGTSTLHVARLSLGDLPDLMVEEKTDRRIAFTTCVTIVVEVSEGKPLFQIERGGSGASLTSKSVQRYILHADAERGRSFAKQLQAEINRCRSRKTH
jgi:hypothetical protein